MSPTKNEELLRKLILRAVMKMHAEVDLERYDTPEKAADVILRVFRKEGLVEVLENVSQAVRPLGIPLDNAMGISQALLNAGVTMKMLIESFDALKENLE